MFNNNLLISAPVFTVLDYFYLHNSSGYFNGVVKNIQGSDIKIRIVSVIFCYIFLIYALNFFILKDKKSPDEAFILGVVIYGVYETTNYAILDNWTPKAVIMDTMWGGILFYLTTYFTYNIKGKKTITYLRYIVYYLYNVLMMR